MGFGVGGPSGNSASLSSSCSPCPPERAPVLLAAGEARCIVLLEQAGEAAAGRRAEPITGTSGLMRVVTCCLSRDRPWFPPCTRAWQSPSAAVSLWRASATLCFVLAVHQPCLFRPAPGDPGARQEFAGPIADTPVLSPGGHVATVTLWAGPSPAAPGSQAASPTHRLLQLLGC